MSLKLTRLLSRIQRGCRECLEMDILYLATHLFNHSSCRLQLRDPSKISGPICTHSGLKKLREAVIKCRQSLMKKRNLKYDPLICSFKKPSTYSLVPRLTSTGRLDQPPSLFSLTSTPVATDVNIST